LTMLDSRGGGSANDAGEGEEFGQSAPLARPRAAQAGGRSNPSFSRDLDDEVPF